MHKIAVLKLKLLFSKYQHVSIPVCLSITHSLSMIFILKVFVTKFVMYTSV